MVVSLCSTLICLASYLLLTTAFEVRDGQEARLLQGHADDMWTGFNANVNSHTHWLS
jgi:hypothetical protein